MNRPGLAPALLAFLLLGLVGCAGPSSPAESENRLSGHVGVAVHSRTLPTHLNRPPGASQSPY